MLRSSSVLLAVALVCSTVGGVGCVGPFRGCKPVKLEIHPADGNSLSPPVLRAKATTKGKPIPGLVVSFALVRGSDSVGVQGDVTTDDDGIATFDLHEEADLPFQQERAARADHYRVQADYILQKSKYCKASAKSTFRYTK